MPDGETNAKDILIAGFFPRPVNYEGVGTFIEGLALGLSERGHVICVLLPEGSSLSEPLLSRVTLVTYKTGLLGYFSYHNALINLSHEERLLLLVENNPNMALYGARASRRYRGTLWYFYTPLQSVSILRELGWSTQGLVHGIAKSACLSRLQNWRQRRVVVASGYQQKQLLAAGCQDVTVSSGSAISIKDKFPDRDKARRLLGWGWNPTVGYLGHYSPAKGTDGLISAFALAVKRHPELRLALAHSGKGNLRPAARQLLEELREKGCVYETGIVAPGLFFPACDVTALPYLSSSIHHVPLALVESFAAGTGVITTPVGGLTDLLDPGKTVEFFRPCDHLDLAEKLTVILKNPQKSTWLGGNARKFFEEHLARERICEAIDQLLDQSHVEK